jgi:N-acetylgalactosamine-6-sulfatase
LINAAMIERLDQAIGRILTALDKAGVAQNTLVIFASDNGGTSSARPMGLHGFKGQTFEGGIRVPCIVRWPGVLPSGLTSNQVALTFDLTASMARAAGVTLPAGRTFDGIDVLARLAAREPDLPRTVFWRQRRGTSTWKGARDGDLKYVTRIVDGRTEVEALFDLGKDMAEEHDLRAGRPDDVARMRQLVAAWEKEVAPVR